MPERYALYFAPSTTDPLWLRAAQWLGRDPAGAAVPPAAIPGIAPAQRHELSVAARRYGFHATLKAPMTLADGLTRTDLKTALQRVAATSGQVEIGRLAVASLEGFIALVPERQNDALTALAANVVVQFDHFRAPLTADERAKRNRAALTPRQAELLDRFGYPYVLDEFRFHMTLTDRIAGPEHETVLEAARSWFAPVLDRRYMLDRICLFHEAAQDMPFVRLADFPLAVMADADA